MGGGMSAASDDGFPTRHAEIALIADAVERGVPTLAVCLGAQLLAAAAGAAVYPGPDGPEIAWAPVELSDAARSDALFAGLPPVLDVLHWHGDTFDLPAGAVRLAAGRRYQNQAFRIGARAWGIQFHLEVDAGAVDTFIASFGDEARQAVGGPEALRSPDALATLATIQAPLLDRFARLVTAPD
jgi:GMP synthase-like glutamine amidotransferase